MYHHFARPELRPYDNAGRAVSHYGDIRRQYDIQRQQHDDVAHGHRPDADADADTCGDTDAHTDTNAYSDADPDPDPDACGYANSEPDTAYRL